MITKTIVWKKDDGSLSITYYDDRDNYDDIVAKHVTGNILKVMDGVVEIPQSRDNRDCWDFDGNKVVEDSSKLKEKMDMRAEKQLTLDKMGLSKDELMAVIRG